MNKEPVREVFNAMVITAPEAVRRMEALGHEGTTLAVDPRFGANEKATSACEASVEFHEPREGHVALTISAFGGANVAAGLLMAEDDEDLAYEEVADAVVMPNLHVPDSTGIRETSLGSLACGRSEGLMSEGIWLG
jgi:hypothetical protein